VIADFSFSEQQHELQRSARRLFADSSPLNVGGAEFAENGFRLSLWQEMGKLGWLGMAIPEEADGGGGNFLDAYALAEEMGRTLLSCPFFDSVAIVGEVIASIGGPHHKEILAQAIEGSSVIGAVIGDGHGDMARSSIVARASGDDWRLDGTCSLVAYASAADHLLGAARTTPQETRGLLSFFSMQNRRA